MKVWDRAGIELATPGIAVKLSMCGYQGRIMDSCRNIEKSIQRKADLIKREKLEAEIHDFNIEKP